jgi:hypothetical protein
MLTQNIAEMIRIAESHAAAHLYKGGKYFDPATGSACFIGCYAKSNDAQMIESTFGLQVMLTRVVEGIFERLHTDDDRNAFGPAIARAIGRDGKDLSRVVWEFLAAELRALPPQTADIQAVINPVIAGMDLLASGGIWDDAAAAAEVAYANLDVSRQRQASTMLALLTAA